MSGPQSRHAAFMSPPLKVALSDEKRVRSLYPDACAWGISGTGWYIFPKPDTQFVKFIAFGWTESRAWEAAREFLQSRGYRI